MRYEEPESGYTYLASDIFPLSKVCFEDGKFPCPHNPEKVLLVDYGEDYMNLPPIEERNHHSVLNIVFLDE